MEPRFLLAVAAISVLVGFLHAWMGAVERVKNQQQVRFKQLLDEADSSVDRMKVCEMWVACDYRGLRKLHDQQFAGRPVTPIDRMIFNESQRIQKRQT